jgi:hypothetical protein
MILHHATAETFEHFDLRFLGNGENHANGALGVWLAVSDSWISGFGANVLDVETDFSSTMTMTPTELRKIAADAWKLDIDAVEHHAEVRRKLMEKGFDSIAIVEDGGAIDMYVAMDLDKVRIVNRRGTEAVI